MDDHRVEKVLAVIRKNVPHGETFNTEFYLNVMKRLLVAVRRKRPEAWTNHLDAAPWKCTCSRITSYSWIFYEACDDCCPPATLLSIFGPCGLFLVPEVEILNKRSPISDGRGDRRKFDTGPSRHPQNTFQDAFQDWKKRWERCIESSGEYFEGDKFD